MEAVIKQGSRNKITSVCTERKQRRMIRWPLKYVVLKEEREKDLK